MNQSGLGSISHMASFNDARLAMLKSRFGGQGLAVVYEIEEQRHLHDNKLEFTSEVIEKVCFSVFLTIKDEFKVLISSIIEFCQNGLNMWQSSDVGIDVDEAINEYQEMSSSRREALQPAAKLQPVNESVLVQRSDVGQVVEMQKISPSICIKTKNLKNLKYLSTVTKEHDSTSYSKVLTEVTKEKTTFLEKKRVQREEKPFCYDVGIESGRGERVMDELTVSKDGIIYDWAEDYAQELVKKGKNIRSIRGYAWAIVREAIACGSPLAYFKEKFKALREEKRMKQEKISQTKERSEAMQKKFEDDRVAYEKDKQAFHEKTKSFENEPEWLQAEIRDMAKKNVHTDCPVLCQEPTGRFYQKTLRIEAARIYSKYLAGEIQIDERMFVNAA